MDPAEFRDALGCFATGITIVTAVGPRGEPVGITASSFSSVSLDPPLILFSLNRRAYSLRAFLSTQSFAVNVLARGPGRRCPSASPGRGRTSGRGSTTRPGIPAARS